ncbi:ribosome recycling factor [Candidatus Kaiserbacteria bacterium CG_4_9_14_0_2_um_filter_41_32]|uniref:Ribosome recycling factor n=1 Tax=Candidatus Kaiserbacteria bacterium CG_4_9_14_0_2_um_filter_41_32 TaxID=1974601 RepID=A0A2M8FEH9_9BACT|nr:MAG: ribosome recycling factor [Candidatus Kaiserbacteria bacterium CG_4_9_14_0_2_um_filter_41_32]
MDESFEQKLKEVLGWLQKEYTGIRTGQATPALLDGIKVESYGTFMPIVQVGSVGIEDARTIRVAPWDLSQVPAIERAIREADLGVSVSSDSMGLRVIFPELTSERRAQLVKLAKSKLEDARVTVRAIRDEVMKDIDAKLKTNDISEDDKFSMKDKVQKSVDNLNRNLETLFTQKESEISL